MKPHGANKSSDYHRAMAEQYLYNATRSLAASDDQLAGFKTWSDGLPRDTSSASHFLGALAGYHTTKEWPWQKPIEDVLVNSGLTGHPPTGEYAKDKSTPGPQGARVDEALPRD